MARDSENKSAGKLKALLDNFLTSRTLISSIVGKIVRPDEIEDIVQETFVLSYAASRKQEIKNPQAFMVKVAKNIAFDQVKRSERKLNKSIEEIDENELIDQLNCPELRYESEEKFLIFCRAVAELPINCRRVYILKKVYGLSMKEISEQLKISQSTVEKHVAKGMLKVMEYIRKMGDSVEGKEVKLDYDNAGKGR